MKAIIIGAGRGSRLRHLTEEIPKTLVPILGRPMLDSILEALAAGGLRPPAGDLRLWLSQGRRHPGALPRPHLRGEHALGVRTTSSPRSSTRAST